MTSDFNPKRAATARQYEQMMVDANQPDVETDTNTGSTEDQCCEDIRQQYIELSNRLHGESHYGTRYLLDLSCEELRDFMQRDLQQEYHSDYGPLHDPETWDNPENVQFREDVAQLLREWDDCLRPGMTSTDDMFVRSGDSFEDAWQVVKELDPLSINPLLQTARGMVRDPVALEESYGLPAGFIGQGGKFVIQPEKRLDPLRAKRAFDSEPARGFTEEQQRVMRALGMDPDNMVGGNDALSLGGRNATGSHPLEFTASNERRQTTGKKPVEWEDLTIRPTFGEMHLKPGDPIEEYEIPSYEYIDNRTGRPIRKPSSILQSKWPYFGNRDWPKVKGLEGMGWHPREGSLGHLSWNRGTGDWDLGPDFPGIKTPSHPLVDDLTIDPSARRQGLGGDLVDLFRYSLPALRMTGRRTGINDELMRNPMETVSARPFWDKYFQSRWTGDDTHIPSDVLDATFESPDPHQGVIRMPPGSKIPGLMGSIKDDDMFLSHRPGLMNQFDEGTPRTLAPLPPENRFNMALTRPRELLRDIGDSSDLDASDRMNRWLARQLIREQERGGGKGRGFKRNRQKRGKKGKFTTLSEQYPHIVRDL